MKDCWCSCICIGVNFLPDTDTDMIQPKLPDAIRQYDTSANPSDYS